MRYQIEELEEILKKIVELNEPNKNEVKNLLQSFHDCKNKLIASCDFNIEETEEDTEEETEEDTEEDTEEEKKYLYLLGRINHSIDQLNILLTQIEQDKISKGLYQQSLESCTDESILSDKINFSEKKLEDGFYHTYLLFNEFGFRCTLAIPATPQVSPLEIHLNFYSTIDLAAHVNNFDIGGPGEEIIKKYQVQLMQKLSEILEQISPENTIWLRVAGFSQGGALAKQCAHLLQKACALQKEDPVQEIIQKIKTNLNLTSQKTPSSLILLQDILKEESGQFKKLNGLTKIQGITLYSHGGPGVSHHIDNMATLMTYYHESDFLRVYHAFHREDIFVQFGEVEFLSGKNGIPRIAINKVILFEMEIKGESGLLPLSDLLPIPSVTGRHMVAHRMIVFNKNHPAVFTIKNVNGCEELEKLNIPVIKHRVYRLLFSAIGLVTSSDTIQKLFPGLDIVPSHPTGKTMIKSRYFPQFDRLGNELIKNIFLSLNVQDQWSFISVNKKYYGLFNGTHSTISFLLNLANKPDKFSKDKMKKTLKKNPKFILAKTNTINIHGARLNNASVFQITMWKGDIKQTIRLLECLKLLPNDDREFIQQTLLKQFNQMHNTRSWDSSSIIAHMEKTFLYYIEQYITACHADAEDPSYWWGLIKISFYYIPEHIRANLALKANFSSYEPQPLKLVEADYKSITEFCQKTKEYFESIKKLLEKPYGLITDLEKINLDELKMVNKSDIPRYM